MVAGVADQPIPGNGDPISEEEALRRLRLSDDPSAQYYAAWWLGRNRSRHPDAVPLLQEALRLRRPRDPGAGVEENAVARNAARALGKLGAPAQAAIPDLLATLQDDDHGLREAAARALGDLRAREAVEPLRQRLASGPAVAGAQQPGLHADRGAGHPHDGQVGKIVGDDHVGSTAEHQHGAVMAVQFPEGGDDVGFGDAVDHPLRDRAHPQRGQRGQWHVVIDLRATELLPMGHAR